MERAATTAAAAVAAVVQVGLALAALAGGVLLVALPSRRRRPAVIGVRVRRRHAALTSLALVAGSLPWPIVLLPAPAGAQCPTPIAVHYHFDRLGSTHLLTAPDGSVRQHTRYSAYGTPRRYAANGAPAAFDPRYRREFTGYETEPYSGLQYAGARFYDPALGMFQTHDPADEFASPYTYTNWDPVNLTDPTGSCVFLGIECAVIGIGIGVGAAIGATAAGIQAAVQGASLGNIFKAAFIGGAIGGATAVVGMFVVQPVLQAAAGPLLTAIGSDLSAKAVTQGILIAGGIAQSSYSISRGDYIGGGIGLALAGVAILGLATQGATPGESGAVAGPLDPIGQLEYSADGFDQRFGLGTMRLDQSGYHDIGFDACGSTCVGPAVAAVRAAPILFRAAQHAPRLFQLIASGAVIKVHKGTVFLNIPGNYRTAQTWFDRVFAPLGTVQQRGSTQFVQILENVAANVRPSSSLHVPTIEFQVYNATVKFRFLEAFPTT